MNCFVKFSKFATIEPRSMNRDFLALFFLALFVQATFYPVVVFHFYVEAGSSELPRSLPDDFPDNGMACYFGFSNNEEETHGEKHNPMLNNEHTFIVCTESILSGKYHIRLNTDHKSTHNEVTTPPPELV